MIRLPANDMSQALPLRRLDSQSKFSSSPLGTFHQRRYLFCAGTPHAPFRSRNAEELDIMQIRSLRYVGKQASDWSIGFFSADVKAVKAVVDSMQLGSARVFSPNRNLTQVCVVCRGAGKHSAILALLLSQHRCYHICSRQCGHRKGDDM